MRPPFSKFTLHRLQHEDTEQVSILIRFPHVAGHRGSLIERPSLLKRPHDFVARLIDAGARLGEDTNSAALIKHLEATLSDEIGVISSTTGWKGAAGSAVFLLPTGMVGHSVAPVLLSDQANDYSLAKASCGTLDQWLAEVAGPARQARPAGAALLASLAGPLLHFSGLPESFVLNLFGNSSSGKTTANRCAASVWGDPKAIPSWNTTDRGLEEIAAANSDIVLILDDAEQGKKDMTKRMHALHGASHLIASGAGKFYSRLATNSGKFPKLTFRCIALSSSPVSVEKSVDRTDGDRVRMLEIGVPHGSEGGIWAAYYKDPKIAARLSDEMNVASSRYFGVAGPVWVEYLRAPR